ncbi:MAG: LegC family aminotransferase [Candidatus Omnitrophica bacterium]|nr:LegC family aminotransferase [Candidatus Omnitrophota bacterium]
MNKKITVSTSINDLIPLSVPEIKGNEWKYIKECLDTNWVSSVGSYVDQFENAVADYVGRGYGVACVNGTSALHVALLLSGIKSQEEVLLPALTFVAPANAICYTGAKPVFIDVDLDNWQIDTGKILGFLKKECKYQKGKLINKNTGRVIKAIMPVHILGHPADMDAIMSIARKYKLKVIEDAAEGLGSAYKNRPLGISGDIACFSFNGNKILTTGGGGMVVVDKKSWSDRARYLITQARNNVLENIHNEIGYNYRLTNIQAAMGFAQMEQLDKFVEKKRDIARRYNEQLKDVPGIGLPKEASWAKSNYWLYTIFVDRAKYRIDSRALLEKLKRSNIQTRPLWHPLHSLKPFKKCFSYKIKVANKLYKNCLSLPSSVGLTKSDQKKVIDIIKRSRSL